MLESNLDWPTGDLASALGSYSLLSQMSFWSFGRGASHNLDTHTKALLTILSQHPVAREMPIHIRLLYIMPTSSSFL
jgi:hypothetical protein